MVGVKFCYLTSIIGQYLEAMYYSKYFFRTPVNVFKESVVDDATDLDTLLNVDTESYDIYFNKIGFMISQQLQGDDAKADLAFFGGGYRESLTRYRSLYPSEVQFTQESYYQASRGGYDGFLPG
jgi:hypothetical protein